MQDKLDALSRETRFAFGKNWSNYANRVDEKALEAAKAGLIRLLPEGSIRTENHFSTSDAVLAFIPSQRIASGWDLLHP